MTDIISIVVAGDFCPTEHVERLVSELSMPSELLGPAVSRFQEADLAIVNLEYPLTTANTRLIKYGSHQKGHPKTISVLKEAGINVVDLANNHILDYGETGLADTLEVCAREQIAAVGAGLTPEEASDPYFVTIRQQRVAVLGICENEFSIARDGRGGAYGLDPIGNYHSIRKAKANADILIVLFHGGSEFSHYPSPRMIRTCRFFADCGASAVVCHHPHYIQGFEVYNGVPILYSLGKLFYTRMSNPGVLEIPIARLDFSVPHQELSVHFDFFRLSLDQMRLIDMSVQELSSLLERFQNYCRALGSPETILSEWDKYCAERKNFYLFLLLSMHPLLFKIARRLGVEHLVNLCAKFKRNNLLVSEHLIRCESHREAVLHILEGQHTT